MISTLCENLKIGDIILKPDDFDFVKTLMGTDSSILQFLHTFDLIECVRIEKIIMGYSSIPLCEEDDIDTRYFLKNLTTGKESSTSLRACKALRFKFNVLTPEEIKEARGYIGMGNLGILS